MKHNINLDKTLFVKQYGKGEIGKYNSNIFDRTNQGKDVKGCWSQ